MSSDSPTLLRLPLELRYRIFDYLSDPESLRYPFPGSPITSISHGAPPRQLLLTCHQFYDEVRTFYFDLTEFRFHALHSSLPKWDCMSPGTLAALRQVKKIKLELVWKIDLQRTAAHPTTWPWWMTQWLPNAVRVLDKECEKLEVVTVSVTDASSDGTWDMKVPLLAYLHILQGKVRFAVGEVIARGNRGAEIRERLEDYLLALNE